MTCQEVMDYMQRQLDGDLDDRETEILMNHTRNCPECARMFERLQLLSSGLENLPKVTPSYSLVDAILPRLAELQASATAPVSESVSVSAEPEQAASRSDLLREKRSLSRFTLAMLGGVVAAGIAFGLFIVNYEPGDPLRRSAADTTASGNASADSASANSTAAPMAAQQSEATGSAPKDGNDVRIGSAQEKASPMAKNSADKGNPTDAGEHNNAASTKDNAAAASAPQQDSVQTKNQYGPEMSPNYSASGSGEQSGTSGSTADSFKAGEVATTQSGGTTTFDIAAPTKALQEWASPDGLYKAAFADSRLKVYLVADGTMLFESPKWPSGIVTLVWAPDSKSFTYETKTEQGITVAYKVDPANGTEEQQTK